MFSIWRKHPRSQRLSAHRWRKSYRHAVTRCGLGGALTLIIVMLTAGCSRSHGGRLPVYDNPTDNTAFKSWTIVGPMKIKDRGASPFPLEVGAPCATESEFLGLVKEAEVSRQIKVTTTSGDLASVDFHRELGLPRPPHLPPSKETPTTGFMFYAACIIESDRPRDVILKVWKDRWAQVFHDGRQVCVYKDFFAPVGPHCFVPLNLHPGRNFVLFKVYNSYERCALQVMLKDDSEANKLAAAFNLYGNLLSKQLYRDGERPQLSWLSDIRGLRVSVGLEELLTGRRWNAVSLARGEPFPSDSPLPTGVYLAHMSCAGRLWNEQFVVGDVQKIASLLKSRVGSLSTSDKDAINVATEIQRLDLLIDTASGAQDLAWQQKLAFTSCELADMAARIGSGSSPTIGIPGLHLRAFRSEIDGSVQNYRIYVPRRYSAGKPVPLAIVPATTVSAARPFIASAFVATHNMALHISEVADEFGFAVLWPGYRNLPSGHPCELTQIDEAIRAVCGDYSVDRTRISIVGSCSAGITAGQAIERWPNRFQSVVFENAIFERDWDGLLAIGRDPLQLKWLRSMSPVDSLIANRRVPLFVINDGTRLDGHGEMELSLKFLQEAEKAHRSNVSSEFGQVLVSNWVRIFSFLSKQQPNTADSVDKDTASDPNRSFVGPFAELFAHPFLVVAGTGGSAAEQKAIQSACAEFQRGWKEMFFGAQCRVCSDSAVTDEDMRRFSLVLIGNPRTNSVWRAYESLCKAKFQTDGIRFDNHDWNAPAVQVASLAVSPAAQDRWIAFIGAPDMTSFRKTASDFSRELIYGWFDTAAWAKDRYGVLRIADEAPLAK